MGNVSAEDSRKIMNDFNFGGLYQCYDEEKGLFFGNKDYGQIYVKMPIMVSIIAC